MKSFPLSRRLRWLRLALIAVGVLLLGAWVVVWLTGFSGEIVLIVLPTINLAFVLSGFVFVFRTMHDAHPA